LLNFQDYDLEFLFLFPFPAFFPFLAVPGGFNPDNKIITTSSTLGKADMNALEVKNSAGIFIAGSSIWKR